MDFDALTFKWFSHTTEKNVPIPILFFVKRGKKLRKQKIFQRFYMLMNFINLHIILLKHIWTRMTFQIMIFKNENQN